MSDEELIAALRDAADWHDGRHVARLATQAADRLEALTQPSSKVSDERLVSIADALESYVRELPPSHYSHRYTKPAVAVLREAAQLPARPVVKALDLSTLLRDAFLAGRGLIDGDKLSEADQRAWAEYDPERTNAYKRITTALSALEGKAQAAATQQNQSPVVTDELLPCPFCGGPAEVIEGEECAYVQCLDMKMHRALWFDGDNAAADEVREQWNRRTEAALPSGVRVKELPWDRNHDSSIWTGELIFNFYYVIYDEGDGFRVFRNQLMSEAGEDEIAFASTQDEAKAAAQADYERRILSALEGEGHE